MVKAGTIWYYTIGRNLNTNPEGDFMPNRSEKHSLRLKPALDYIRDNPDKMPTLGEMASLCGLSVSYFSRLFHREIGISFINYVNKTKVEAACARLREAEKVQVALISDELGFSDASYFIRVFKKTTGTTPNGYRKKYRMGLLD